MGAASAGMARTPDGKSVPSAISLCRLPPGAAGTGWRDLPGLSGREESRPQGRRPAVLSGTHRRWQDHEHTLPRSAVHGRRKRRKDLLSYRAQHGADRRRGRRFQTARILPRACPAYRDTDGEGEGVPASGRRGPPCLSAGAVPLCKRLLRPHQGCVGIPAGFTRFL